MSDGVPIRPRLCKQGIISVSKIRTHAWPRSTPLPEDRFFHIIERMDVQLTAETQKKLKDLAAQTGRPIDDIVEGAMAGYFDEVLQIRETLDSRYDDVKSGMVKLISGDQVEAYFTAIDRRINKDQIPFFWRFARRPIQPNRKTVRPVNPEACQAHRDQRHKNC